ncbi:MAG TPA: cytochrome c-type biogenesis protein [Xanthobacteraceae bacterium]|jgi:cytochrome c-type biogenesis protein CcmH|nr:cytochrome c-type biogenesis protein [Xanthobacteraceae bacterium]
MRLLRLLLIASALLSAAPAWSVQPDEVLADPTLEARARALSKELRCLVCQNQSIDDSAAPLARDIRLLVRERLTKGDSDQQVLDFLVARYGEFVLLKPRFAWHTALLWLVPPAGLIGGGLLLFLVARRRTQATPVASRADALTPAEEARLAGLLQTGDR